MLVYSLIVALLASTFHRELGIAFFYGFRDFISQEFCENTDMPELACDGRCFLNDKILQSYDESSENPTPLASRILLIDFNWFVCDFVTAFSEPDSEFKHQFFYSNLYTFQDSKKFYFPPWLIS